MTSLEDTVTVPAETYSYALPEEFEEETIEIGLTAFKDKLYMKFPRFDRGGTNDFCMSASAIFEATVDMRDRRGLEVKPILKRLNVLRHMENDYAHGDPDDVAITHIGDVSNCNPAHLKLVEEFSTTVAGFDEDDYWQGYRRGANAHGDEQLSQADVAWKCFKDRWEGNRELLLDVGKWFAHEGYAVCSRSRALFPAPRWAVPTGSYVATISDVHAGKCPFCGADKDEHWECVKKSNRTRVPNTYKCQECGNTKKGITTG